MADESAREATPRRYDMQIDRLWDAAASGRLTEPATTRRLGRDHDDRADHDLDPRLAATIRRVHTLAGQPLADTDRAERLWRDLMDGYAPTTTLRFSPDLSLPTNGGHTLPRPAAASISRPRRGSARLSTGLSYIATAALIAAALALVFVVYRNEQRATVVVQETPVEAIGTPAAVEPRGWLQFKGDAARTGNVAGPGPVGEPVELWSVPRVGEGFRDTASNAPVVADGILFLDDGGGLVARDVFDGSEVWRAEDFGGSPAIHGDGIITRSRGSSSGLDLARLRRSDGSVVWRGAVGLQDDWWSPAIVDGVVYIPSGPSDLIALDAATGAELWRAPLAAPAQRSASVADGVVYMGLGDGTLVAVEAGSGDLLWTAPAPGGTLGVPTIAHGTVYLSTRDLGSNSYHAFDQATGAPRWTFATESGAGFYYGSVDATTVYVPSEDGALYALDAATGAPLWQFTTGAGLTSTPIVIGDVVYQAASDGFLYAVDAATGEERWRFALDGATVSSPAIVDGVIFVAVETGALYAIGGVEATAQPISTPRSETSPVTDTTSDLAVTATVASAEPSVEFVWASTGDDGNRLLEPTSVRLLPDGRLLVTSMPGQIFIFDLDGNVQEVWDDSGAFRFTDGEYVLGGLTVAPDGTFYVVDSFNYRIRHYDADKALIGEFGSLGSGDGQFLGAASLAVEPGGTLLVADPLRGDVQRFTADGTFVDSFDGTGTPEGGLLAPVGIAVDGDGVIYVVEIEANRVRMFSADGTSLGSLGANGPGFGGLNFPGDVVIDGDGYIHVTDQNSNRIVVFDPDGRFVFTWGGEFGIKEGQFNQPSTVAINAGGTVYVADWRNNRIQKFKITGTFPAPAVEATPIA